MITASIVVHNTPQALLQRVLESAISSSLVPQIYIVDNSPVALSYPEFRLPGITYIRAEKNVGYGGGHNLALRAILDSSEFHFIWNPDIFFGPNELEKMVDFMRSDLSIGQLMPKVVYADGSLQYLCKLLPTPVDLFQRRFSSALPIRFLRKRMDRFELRFTNYDRVMDVPYLSGCFMLFRVSALRKIGLFDERFFMYPEDIDITRRMHANFRSVFFPEATIVHDHARESYRSTRSLWVHMVNMAKYFNKWGWFRDPERSRVNADTLQRLQS